MHYSSGASALPRERLSCVRKPIAPYKSCHGQNGIVATFALNIIGQASNTPVMLVSSVHHALILLKAAPVAERLRVLFLNHSIISPLCLVWVRAPL